MPLALLLGALSSLAVGLPIAFDSPDDLIDAQGIALAPQPPTRAVVLMPRDTARSALWYSPVGIHPALAGTYVWYQRVNKDEPEYSDQRTLCLGMIRGDQWEMPVVQTDPPAWGGPNNGVLRRSPHKPTWGGFNVFQLVFANGHFRMLYWDQPEEGDAGAMLAMSVGGVKWVKDPRGTVFTDLNDAFTLLPKGNGFLLFQTALEPWPGKPLVDNLPGRRRVISVRSSDNLVNWSPQKTLLAPDASDPETTEFYLMKAFPFKGQYLGLLMKYWADPDKPAEHSSFTATELIVSPDATTWKRPYRNSDLGFWTYAEPYWEDGTLRFVAGREGRLELLEYEPGRLFGAACSGGKEGSFVTAPFALPSADLVLDADARNGSISVEVLDTAKQPLGGIFPCRVSDVNDRRIPLEWSGFFSELPAREIRLRFTIRDAAVFAVTILDGKSTQT